MHTLKCKPFGKPLKENKKFDCFLRAYCLSTSPQKHVLRLMYHILLKSVLLYGSAIRL